MSEPLEQDTEEFESKYNLIFDNPVSDNIDVSGNINQILGNSIANEINEIARNNDDSLAKERAEECTALVTVKERRLMAAQTMFKKSIKLSIKSFLISLSLSFLNLFI